MRLRRPHERCPFTEMDYSAVKEGLITCTCGRQWVLRTRADKNGTLWTNWVADPHPDSRQEWRNKRV